MAHARITVSDDLKRLPQTLRLALTEAMAKAGEHYVGAIQVSMQQRGTVASGQTKDAVRVVESSLERTVIECPAPSKLIEEGRPPGKVPRWAVFEPILAQWAKDKPIAVQDNLYPIARKIREQGFKGRYPIKLAVTNSTVNDDAKKLFVSIIGDFLR